MHAHRRRYDSYSWRPFQASPGAVAKFAALANGDALPLPDGTLLRAVPVDPEIDRHHGTLTFDVGPERYRAELRAGTRWFDGGPLRTRDVAAIQCGVAA